MSPDAQARGHCAPPFPMRLPSAGSRVKVRAGVTLGFGDKPHLKSASARSNLAYQPVRPTHCALPGRPPGCHRSLPADPSLARRPLGLSQATQPSSAGSGAAPSGGRPPGDCAVLGSLGMPLLRAAALAGELSTARFSEKYLSRKERGWEER